MLSVSQLGFLRMFLIKSLDTKSLCVYNNFSKEIFSYLNKKFVGCLPTIICDLSLSQNCFSKSLQIPPVGSAVTPLLYILVSCSYVNKRTPKPQQRISVRNKVRGAMGSLEGIILS